MKVIVYVEGPSDKLCLEKLLRPIIESLVLAGEEALLTRVGKQRAEVAWTRPVEDQNHNDPPKRIVERIFQSADKRYRDTVDAPWIVENSNFEDLIQRCPKAFSPFVEDMKRLVSS